MLKLDELISQLQQLRDTHGGEHNVVVRDDDTDHLLPVLGDDVVKTSCGRQTFGPYVLIESGGYGDRLD